MHFFSLKLIVSSLYVRENGTLPHALSTSHSQSSHDKEFQNHNPTLFSVICDHIIRISMAIRGQISQVDRPFSCNVVIRSPLHSPGNLSISDRRASPQNPMDIVELKAEDEDNNNFLC